MELDKYIDRYGDILIDKYNISYFYYLIRLINKNSTKKANYINNKQTSNIIGSFTTERFLKNQVFTLYVIWAQCREWYRLKPVFL